MNRVKRLYEILRTLLGSFIGVFIGTSIYKYWDYRDKPELYEMQSAPWYLSIEINAVFTLVIAVILLAAMWFVRKKMK